MKSNAERCAEYERFKKIDAAFKAGDLAALRNAVEDPASIPNGPMPLTIGACLEYAIYHSPLPFITELLEIGADPHLRTRIDDCETPREMAENVGRCLIWHWEEVG
ncbi:hypothetical protein SKTS_13310 [Sulfurimicrobium lacus]|uniref:Ankyrin repeat domain-containing protein n=1 Tax=Sulfurimicrobium lacus TaxID=2715678 RepID=A0A6F8VCG0_9PROT|nr:hypothetical protein [Sulfurimicrobium lacus]BCB26445.1 hypothetical protein SKTS_13310 [Sulfurimicrobium lacus]